MCPLRAFAENAGFSHSLCEEVLLLLTTPNYPRVAVVVKSVMTITARPLVPRRLHCD
jgi:hypothetical protein